MVNRYTNAQTYQGSLYTPPLDLVGKSLQYFQGQYDKNYELANTIKNNFIQSLPQDRAVANEMQRNYETQIDAIVSKYGNDYSKASDELNKLTYQIKKDYGPGGKAGAIIGNYTAYNQWMKQQQDLVEKGKALGEDLNLANDYYMKNYKGIGEFDPISGNYNRFNADQLTEYVNPDDIIQNVYKNFKPEKHRVARTTFENGQQVTRDVEVEGISANRLTPSFNSALQQNPKYQAYLQQQSKFRGLSGKEVEASIAGYVQQRAQDLSYASDSDIVKRERDPLALLHERHRLKKQEQQDFFSAVSAFEYNPTTEVSSRKESTIDPNGDWRTSKPTMQPFGYSSNLAGTLGTDSNVRPTTKQTGTFREALNNPEYVSSSRINKQLAQQIFEDKKNEIQQHLTRGDNGTFESKYGKDMKWTEAFDKEVAMAYKKAEASHSRMTSKAQTIVSPVARTNVLEDIAGQLADPKTVSVYKAGSMAMQTAEDAGLTRSALVDDNGKLKYSNVKYVYPGGSNPVAGYQITTDKGTFVVVDQNVDRYNASQQINAAISPIFQQGKSIGNPLLIGEVTANGQRIPQYGVPELRYEKNSSGTYDENLYMNYLDGQGNVYNRSKIGMEDIYKGYQPIFDGALGAGASKKDLTMFQLFMGGTDNKKINYAR